MHGPDFRPSCQATHFSARRKLPVSAVLSCVSQTHWNRNTALLGQSTTLRAKPSNREFTGGIRCHFRRSVLSRGVWNFQAWRTGADGEGGENPQGETRGHSSSRKQDAQIFECPRWRGMVLAQTRRRVPVAAMRQLPQPHPVRRHYCCGPRRGKVGKPAESNCYSSHLRCAGIGVAGSIPRNGMGMAQGPCLAPWAAGQSAMIAYHKERVTLDAARKTMGWLWSDRFRRKRAERRLHQEGGPGGTRPLKCEWRQGEGRQEGRARRGTIRPGRDPPGHPPGPRLPDISKSPLSGGWGVFLSCLIELGKRAQLLRLLHQRAISPLAQCRAGLRIPIASSRCHPRQRRSEVRSASEALILGWLLASTEFRCPLCQAPFSWVRSAHCSASSWSRVPRRSVGIESGQVRPIPPGLRFHS